MDEIREMLYNLGRSELRALAWEALLMSDGPDKIGEEVNSTVHVEAQTEGNGPWLFKVSSEQW